MLTLMKFLMKTFNLLSVLFPPPLGADGIFQAAAIVGIIIGAVSAALIYSQSKKRNYKNILFNYRAIILVFIFVILFTVYWILLNAINTPSRIMVLVEVIISLVGYLLISMAVILFFCLVPPTVLKIFNGVFRGL